MKKFIILLLIIITGATVQAQDTCSDSGLAFGTYSQINVYHNTISKAGFESDTCPGDGISFDSYERIGIQNKDIRLYEILPASKQRSKLFSKNSIITYSLCFAGGFSDGLNDCIVANKFYYDPFWGLDAWQNKGHYSGFREHVLTFSCDGWHLTKFVTPLFYSAAIGVNLNEKQNWKIILEKALISFIATRAGHELCYGVIFKNYPK